jgi:hypothetical protein
MVKTIIALITFIALSVNAESVWMDDGSLVIIDSQETIVYIDEDNKINYDVKISNDEPTFIYNDKLTVCQPTNSGSICY